jgi:excinuclease ABC subunit A
MPAKPAAKKISSPKPQKRTTENGKRKNVPDVIQVRGAHQNNLRGFDLDLPLGQLCVVTGPSGSGKSSLAFDTIYAEGQRRYVETFSPYTRQFFERMDKPKVDAIHGIPPAIAIEQVNNIRSTRSTVGSITEINDYLKMLFPRLAEATCPECHRPVRPETPESILATLLSDHPGATALIGFGVPVPPDTDPADFFPFLQSQGYLRVWLYGETLRTDEPASLGGKKLPAIVTVIQDRLTLDPSQKSRLSEALEAALRLGKGTTTCILTPSGDQPRTKNQEPRTRSFSTDWRCADCDLSLPAPTPGLFSFNNPIGACPTCRGFGRTLGLDLRKAIPDESLSIDSGLVRAFQGSTYSECQADLVRAAKRKGISLKKAFDDFTDAERHWLIEGEGGDPDDAYNRGDWYGVSGFFKWLESRAYKMHVRIFLSRFRAYTTCPDCNGGRLKKNAYNYRLAGKTIADLWQLPVTDLLPFLHTLPVAEADSPTRMLRDEITSRLGYMDRAGLGYIHLDRQTRTLSGGELQRVNLTTCLGASLVNTLFVLDEPSIGLHPRDIGRLIGVMEGLRDRGNTLLVVEHEEAVMRAADHIIEIGPGRGDKGGNLVYSGPLPGLEKLKGSLTADYLTGRKTIPVPATRRKAKHHLKITGARQNNLKKLDVELPLGVFCCLTGVSGSGKSTLVHEVLYRNLQRLRGEVTEDEPGIVRGITGHEKISQVVMVDQSPLARTPRSTPAVYIGAFDTIRDLFAATEDAKAQGVTPGFFSFNSGQGRCERCAGNGFEKIEMQFLSDLYVTCPECEGKRYQPHALQIKLDGKSIHDVLQLTIEEAVAWCSSGILPEGSPSGILPEKNHAGSQPKKSSSGILPERSLSGILPEKNNAGSQPKKSSSGILPERSLSGILPEKNNAGSQPKKSSSGILPERSLSGILPEKNNAGSQPEKKSSSGILPAPQKLTPHQKRLASLATQLSLLVEAGLGYLKLGQPLNTLSGGEAQRLKLVGHLLNSPNLKSQISNLKSPTPLLLLDEPTTGLHFDDIALLLKLLQRLVDQGNSLIVIEHNLDVIQCADWVIDLGPEAGANGGQITATGTPEQIAQCEASWTGKYLAEKFNPNLAEKPLAYRAAPRKTEHGTRTNAITIRGAREHNLKNITVEIPRDEFVVISGLSGSGKSSLAFDLVFAEGQRRFLDSMSVYARTFVEQMEKPEVDLISGVPPTVAIEQRISRGGGKSTVATVTEVWHFLRLLFAKLGTQYCPKCDLPVEKQSVSAIVQTLAALSKKGSLHLMAPLIKARKGFHTEVADHARKHGIETLFVDGQFKSTLNFKKLERFKEHTIDAVIAQIDKGTNGIELRPLVEQAIKMGKGTLRLLLADKTIQVLNTEMSCPGCGTSFEELDPRLFSFNSPHGWCKDCRGFGFQVHSHGAEPRRDDISQLEAELEEERRLTRGSRSDSDDEDGEKERLPCPTCQSSRLNEIARSVKLITPVEQAAGLPSPVARAARSPSKKSPPPTLQHLNALSAIDAAALVETFTFTGTQAIIARDILAEIKQRLKFMQEVGLGYLQLNRSADTLSGGEAQRIRLAAQLGSNLRGVLYVLDEPTIGLHPRDNVRLLDTLVALRDKGNSLLVVEHDDDTMRRADTIIDLGPGAGRFGGEVISQGNLQHILKDKNSVTGHALRHPMQHPLRGSRRALPSSSGILPEKSGAGILPASKNRNPGILPAPKTPSAATSNPDLPSPGWLTLTGATANNLKNITVQIPLSRLTVITGVSGSGKSTFLHSALLPAVKDALAKPTASKGKKKKTTDQPWKTLTGTEHVNAVYEVDQSPIGKTSRSCPATYVGILDDIRKLFAQVPLARARGYGPGRFSFNTDGGRCDTCQGNGEIKVEMAFLPTTRTHCEICNGMRFNSATQEIEFNGKNIGQVLKMSITEAADFFASQPRISRPLQLLAETGVGYLQLGQASPTLSGGEAQRLKLVTELSTGQGRTATERLRGLKNAKRNLYLIEEPTIGLHMADVKRLIDILHRLVDEGHTVVVIEHHPDVFAEADYLIDIGPEAGAEGGHLVAQGTPEQVAQHPTSRTAPFLKAILT